MNDRELIDTLLSRQEADDLDFKSGQYHLGNNHTKSQFIKDILAMANTPRAGSAYILVGVAEKSGRVTDIPGVSEHPDEAELGRIVSSKVNPAPRFTYRQISYNDVELGLIEIPCDQSVPIMPRTDYKVIRRGCVYIRRNTENTEADEIDITRIIQWRQGLYEPHEPPHSQNTQSGSWDHFYRACDDFDSRRIYIAVLDREQNVDARDWIAMASIQWCIIIDLDTGTDTDGNYLIAKDPFSERRALRISALDDSPTVSARSTVWVAAAGLDSRPTTNPSNNWREWSRSKVPQLERTINELAKISEPAPVTLVVFSGEAEYVSTICEIVDRIFRNRIEYMVANPDPDRYRTVVERFEASCVAISLPIICQGLRDTRPDPEPEKEIQFPKLDGGTVAVAPDRARWLEEQLELIHWNIDSVEDDRSEEAFLKGETITWRHLNIRVDVDRDIRSKLERQIRKELELRATRRVNFWHWPGAGGTTVARRIAWNLQRDFPTVVAHEIQPHETAERLRHLFAITKLPILVVIDLPGVTKEIVDRFYDTLRSSHTPAVIFNVERKFDVHGNYGPNFLDAALTTREAAALSQTLAIYVPGRRQALEQLVSESDRRKRIPFYFGLTAFGRDFQGIESYVGIRLSQAAESVREVMILVALTYSYGQISLSPQIFSSIFSIPVSKLINMSEMLPGYIYELLIEENRKIRPTHQLIAEEILKQDLGRERGDQRSWRTGLADLAIKFIDLLANLPHQDRGTLSEILRAVLIERRSAESPAGPWEAEFSRFLNDVPSVDGKQRVLEHLSDMFPEESHFWAHLGRFYTRIVQSHSKAHEAHQRALQLSPNDSLLHHMAGMGWRDELYGVLDAIKEDFSENDEKGMFRIFREATQEFDKARSLNRRSEYNYISQIQMILRVITSIARVKGYPDCCINSRLRTSSGGVQY